MNLCGLLVVVSPSSSCRTDSLAFELESPFAITTKRDGLK